MRFPKWLPAGDQIKHLLRGGLHLDVTEFGAIGDGSTDDTAAFEAAISRAKADGGGLIYLPAGHYRITSLLTVDFDNLGILGAGLGSSIIETEVAGGPFLNVLGTAVDNRKGFWISDVGINGQGVAGSQGIQFDYADYKCSVRSVDMELDTNSGVIENNPQTDVLIYNVTVNGTEIGLFPLLLGGTTVPPGWYDVTASPYNADNTGSVSAHAAINQAISDASAAGGGTVYFPPGTYRLGGQITLASDVHLLGNGPGVSILNMNVTHTRVVFGQNVNGWGISELEVRSQGGATYGIEVDGCDDWHMDHVKVFDFIGVGVRCLNTPLRYVINQLEIDGNSRDQLGGTRIGFNSNGSRFGSVNGLKVRNMDAANADGICLQMGEGYGNVFIDPDLVAAEGGSARAVLINTDELASKIIGGRIVNSSGIALEVDDALGCGIYGVVFSNGDLQLGDGVNDPEAFTLEGNYFGTGVDITDRGDYTRITGNWFIGGNSVTLNGNFGYMGVNDGEPTMTISSGSTFLGDISAVPLGSGPTQLAAGQTRFLLFGSAGLTTVEFEGQMPLQKRAYYRGIRISLDVAPGVGESVTVNIRKNGSQFATFSISGGATQSGADNTATLFVPNDKLSVELVASAGAASAKVIGSVTFMHDVRQN